MGQRALMVLAASVLLLVPVAAFAGAVSGFDDVPDDSIYASDIAWIKDAGVTKGCNPPANTLYCPDDDVSREQMAAFMHRLATNRVVDAGTVEGMTAAELKGQTGDTGPAGAAGPKGDQGVQGVQGATGNQGIQGLTGDKGDQGDQGIQGLTGDKGDKGDQGDQGIQGLAGDKGDQGDQGIQGLTGDKGDQGDQGVQGEKGDQGDQGDQGDPGQDGTGVVLGFYERTAEVSYSGLFFGTANINSQSNPPSPKCDAGDYATGNWFWISAAGGATNNRIYHAPAGDSMTLSVSGLSGSGSIMAGLICADMTP